MRLLKFIPISLLIGITIYTWSLLLPNYSPTLWHILGLLLLILNLFFFKYSVEKGHLLTFFLLLLGTFGLCNFTFLIVESSYFIRISSLKINFPSINPNILFILILYIFVNNDILKKYIEKIRDYLI